MKIKNRLQDIRDAQTRVLQDFFELEIVKDFPNNQWVSELYAIVQNEQVSASYAGTWTKFRCKGIQGFTLKDMDATIIIAVLSWKNNLTTQVDFNQFKHIQKRFSTLADDRNFNAHMTSNEPPAELFQWACGTINNLRMFLKAVCKHSTATTESTTAFYQKHELALNKISKDLEADYDEWRKECEFEERKRNEISCILNSSDPFAAYVEINEKYHLRKDPTSHLQFQIRVADAGITFACPSLGDFYFEGLTVERDYEKAAAYYEQGFQHLRPLQIVRLGSIYINQISSQRSQEEGQRMVDSCKPPLRAELCTYTTGEGFVFYTFRKQKVD